MDQVVPSVYHTWYYTTLPGRHRRECQLFRYQVPSLGYQEIVQRRKRVVNALIWNHLVAGNLFLGSLVGAGRVSTRLEVVVLVSGCL